MSCPYILKIRVNSRFHCFRILKVQNYSKVKQFQVKQSHINGIEILVVTGQSGLNDAELSKIKYIVSRRCGSNFDVKISEVPKIPQTSSGKWRYVISELNAFQ